MAELKDWDIAAANNDDASPDGAPEGMAPSGLNDTIREGMAVLARWKGDNDGTLDSGGSGGAYTLSPNGTYSAYSRGDTFRFEANHTNAGSASLNVSSLGVKTIKDTTGNALAAGLIRSGGVYEVIYDGTDFLLMAPSLPVRTGSWTPVVEFGGATTGITYTSQVGGYYRMGPLVVANFDAQLSSKGSASGNATVSGLPFAAQSILSASAEYGCNVIVAENFTGLTGSIVPVLQDSGAGSEIEFRAFNATGTGTTGIQLTDANFTNTSRVFLSVVYVTTAA